MAVTDATTFIFLMLKVAREQREVTEVAEERNRRDTMIMFQEIRTRPTNAATSHPTDRFSYMKINFKEFSDETED